MIPRSIHKDHEFFYVKGKLFTLLCGIGRRALTPMPLTASNITLGRYKRLIYFPDASVR